MYCDYLKEFSVLIVAFMQRCTSLVVIYVPMQYKKNNSLI